MKITEKHTACPNCSYITHENYCANCGQKNHLHKDTFTGLVTHFVAHYFHYDSKFQQTLKLLLTRPGKLTLAYREGKRQRYVAPISLYIFISIVFFLAFSIRNSIESANASKASPQQIEQAQNKLDSKLSEQAQKSENMGYFYRKLIKLKKEKGLTYLAEKFSKHLPKIFFFMIPVLALLLKLIYFKNKKLFFVDHAIFALHYHTFWFILMFLNVINPFKAIEIPLILILLFSITAYLVMALRNVYGSSWMRNVAKVVLIILGYLTFMGIVMGIDIFIILAMV